jgi:hypothetical protein
VRASALLEEPENWLPGLDSLKTGDSGFLVVDALEYSADFICSGLVEAYVRFSGINASGWV